MEADRGGGPVVVFGGTFDPPHIGHLVVAQDALESLGAERFLFVPSGEPPHKAAEDVTPAALRLEMVRAALGGDPRFEVSEVELQREGPSYMADTLRELHGSGVRGRPFLLLGADQLGALPDWERPHEVVAQARVAVMEREGEAPLVPPTLPGLEVVRVPVTRIDVSSSEVRRRIGEGRPVRHLVPRAVAEIIEREGLYRAGGSTAAPPAPPFESNESGSPDMARYGE